MRQSHKNQNVENQNVENNDRTFEHVPETADERALCIEQMAKVIKKNREAGDDITNRVLVEKGFTERQIEQHGNAAWRLSFSEALGNG